MPNLKFQMAVAIAERIVDAKLCKYSGLASAFLLNRNFWSEPYQKWETMSPAWQGLKIHLPEILKELDARKD